MLTGVRQMEVREVPDPVIERDTDVLLKIEKVGVCGSDVHYYETGRIGSQVVQFPFIVGHECAATVAKVGPGVKHVKVGQEVVVEPAVSCHACEQCNQGRENTCFNLRFLGTPGQGEGCLSEYLVMPEECCLPTEGRISIEQGVLCEPLAIAVYAVKQSKPPEDADVAMLGAGPIGLSCMVSAQAEGVRACYLTEKIDERVETAGEGGATWVGNPLKEEVVAAILKQQPLGMDVVYECAGQQETIDQAVELLKPGGKLMLIGIPREDRISFAIDKIRRKEITIINVRRQNACTQAAIDLLASGRGSVDFMVTHRFGLEQTRDAFELVAGYRDGVVKAMIQM
ncbi:MAG: alcohol dehydrogenase catalytic domain-containing protein [Phycisphaerales bacterium]|nr:MAG: alcohol dehydrogenase catalytic domain-containing protein [Phycisphaerales bacterium]